MARFNAFPDSTQALARVVYEAKLDHAAFSVKLRPCELNRCRATCCHDGVYLSEEEFQNLKFLVSEKPGVFASLPGAPRMEELFDRSSGGKLKTSTREADDCGLSADYPKHFPRTRCRFLTPEHHCALQRYSISEKLHPWFYKPLTCWIHPILITRPDASGRATITLPQASNDPQKTPHYPGFSSCTHCGRTDDTGQVAHQVLRHELERLSEITGRDLLRELQSQPATEA